MFTQWRIHGECTRGQNSNPFPVFLITHDYAKAMSVLFICNFEI